MMGFGMMSMGGGLLWILIIGVVIYMINNNRNNRSFGYDRYRNNDPLDILDERFAKGEITEEEYLQKKKMLKY